MKSITIHGLDRALDERIRERARHLGLSLNKTIKQLLAESLGLQERENEDPRKNFMDLFGIWTQEETKEFNEIIQKMRRIDTQDWQ